MLPPGKYRSKIVTVKTVGDALRITQVVNSPNEHAGKRVVGTFHLNPTNYIEGMTPEMTIGEKAAHIAENASLDPNMHAVAQAVGHAYNTGQLSEEVESILDRASNATFLGCFKNMRTWHTISKAIDAAILNMFSEDEDPI